MSDLTALTEAQSGEYLSFRLGNEEYGIPILTVQEIRGYQEPTLIANAPPAIKGVVNPRVDQHAAEQLVCEGHGFQGSFGCAQQRHLMDSGTHSRWSDGQMA